MCQTIVISYLELKLSSTHEHLELGYSLPFPAARAFHVQCSEVLLFLTVAALRARRQFEPKAVTSRCAHLGICVGLRLLHSCCRWEGSKVGRSLINRAVPCPLRCMRSRAHLQLPLQKGTLGYVSYVSLI